MEKMMDYLKWRGDIPFSVSPLNEADCYLICKIGAIDWAGIIPRQGEPIPFRYAAEKYFLKYGEEGSSTVKLAGPELIPILKKASVSERYGGIGLSGFINIIEERKTEQFSALTATLPDGMRFITFRGTDDNILAWKENFYLSCSDYVSAQRDALAYLRYHSTLFEGPFIVGGHSKGGNLAIYASCAADESIRNRIDSVYCFDGPGFHSEYYDSPGYADMKSRIFKIIPKNSLVGTLLDNPEDVITVSSEDFGIAGHSGFNWETCASGFVKCGELSKSSRVFDSSIDSVLGDMDNDSRRDFIDTLFDILDSRGARTVTELTEKGRKAMLSLGVDLIKTEETKRFIYSLIRQIARDYVTETQRGIREENRAARRERELRRQARAIHDMQHSEQPK